MPAGLELLDPEIRAVLKAQGIEGLYPPQEEALPIVASGKNVVVAIPTAAGKSLIAYLAIALKHRRRPKRGKALYIVPLRALAWEKYEELKAFRPLGLTVGLATGDLDEEDRRLSQFDVVVATSEKADSLLRHRAQWLELVDLVVADEVHLINDGGRGPTLEVLLARFRAQRADLQVVALSATIANAREIAEWLDAALVESAWRPTPLKRGILYGKTITFHDNTKRTLTADEGDPVADLVLDILKEGAQALVFVNTRRSAEAVAERLASLIGPTLDANAKGALLKVSEDILGASEPTRSVERLAAMVRHGAAFHNAGLDARHRRIIEGRFRAGDIKCLAATPTLAAGVNTPARRVIVRDVWRYEANLGSRPLPVLEVFQMMGRAGRPRYDPYGEAVLIAKTEEERETLRESYIDGDPEPILSKLGAEPALRVHTLATVASGFALSVEALERFLDSTFYAHQGEAWLIKERVRAVIDYLVHNGFLESDGARLSATLFGKRTSDLYIDPMSALTLKKAIEEAKLRTDVSSFAFLHAMAATVDLGLLYLRTRDDWVYDRAMDEEGGFLLRESEALSQEDFLAQVKTAALLEDWIEETPMARLEEKYGVGPGDVREKVDTGRWLAHALRELARLFDYHPPAELTDLTLRLEAGVRKELLPLVRLSGVGRVRARRLFAAGFTSLAKLRAAKKPELERIDLIGPRVADQILAQVQKDGTEPKAETPTLEGF